MKKIEPDSKCLTCQGENLTFRYGTILTLSDSSCSLECIAFDECMQELLGTSVIKQIGMTADNIRQLGSEQLNNKLRECTLKQEYLGHFIVRRDRGDNRIVVRTLQPVKNDLVICKTHRNVKSINHVAI